MVTGLKAKRYFLLNSNDSQRIYIGLYKFPQVQSCVVSLTSQITVNMFNFARAPLWLKWPVTANLANCF